ncbi:Zn-ribbon domain-containing protein [Halorussus halophilus]|uniref:Zn-ribbon domain-containing protein n=1 Tax=Halorussus halophilus TaxID=2650975 RepID=UPI0013010BC3|nr:Zn-ribbon containing protein [Halorussus halophilus]
MPHQCTNCGRAFEDGSKEMLSGCPDCGGNKFQFLPAGAVGDSGGSGGTTGGTAPKKQPQAANTGNAGGTANAASSPDAPETGGDTDSTPSGAVDRAAATVRDWVSTKRDRGEREQSAAASASQSRSQTQSRSAPNSGSTRNEGQSAATDAAPAAESNEDSAQASARRDLVSEDELPDDPPAEDTDDANVVSPPEEESPGLDELRKELNDQFESIRIVNPGQYELNLMELYNREEYIIALKQDGKYVIEVPDSWEQ